MTREQFLQKYGDVKVKFSYYYKFTFSFSGKNNGLDFYVTCGGSSDEIYRFEVTSEKEPCIKDLGFNYANVEKDGKIIDECDE